MKVSLAQSQQKINFWVGSGIERLNTGGDGSGQLSEYIRGILWQELLLFVPSSSCTFGIGTQDRNWWRFCWNISALHFYLLIPRLWTHFPVHFPFTFPFSQMVNADVCAESQHWMCPKIFRHDSIYFRFEKWDDVTLLKKKRKIENSVRWDTFKWKPVQLFTVVK